MWTHTRRVPFSTPQPEKNPIFSSPPYRNHHQRPLPSSEKKWTPSQSNNVFHIVHKLPAGDSPYVRAKHVQLVDNNPSKAISLFWAAINSGDRVDSALKDMAVVMKQLNRSDEAIEAIKSFRHLCQPDAHESLDNILLELYKRSGRVEEQIELLQLKLKHIEEATSLDGNRTKFARSQGKKIQITVGQEYSRLLGNLAWAHLQQDNYKLAEEIYRKALSLEPDKNKKCNLAICLMYMDKMTEAKFLLSTVKNSNRSRDVEEESYAKSYERAVQVMDELEMENTCHTGNQISFSSFLNRNKETDSIDKETKWKRSDSDSGFRNQYVSPSPVNATPRVPLTQPRRRDWERADSAVGCFNRNKETDSIDKETKWKRSDSDSGFRNPYVSPSPVNATPRVPLTQPRRRDWERADSAVGCFRKLHFEKAEEVNQRELSGNCNVEAKLSSPGCEMSKVSPRESLGLSKVITEERKKSWADMVEEDEEEQDLLESTYHNENMDCNILNQKIESLSVHDGYQTQPGSAECRRNQMVKRCLTFDRSEKQYEHENYWSCLKDN